MAKNEKTSEDVGTKASKLLSNPRVSKAVKSAAALALTQRPDKKVKRRKRPKIKDRCAGEAPIDRRDIYDY